jgi:ABC-2 type transport system permease protein
MTAAMFRVMWLSLLNDRGAFAMAFIMPVLFFLVMAEIFSSTTGGPIMLRVAFANEAGDDTSLRLVDALQASGSLEVVGATNNSRSEVNALVAKGTADVGIVFPAGARSLDDVGGIGPAPIILVNDPVRSATVPMLSGLIQKTYFEALPDIALGGVVTVIDSQFVALEPEQLADIDIGLQEMAVEARAGRQGGWSFGEMIEQHDIAGRSAATNHVAYYAGAVAFLFLLFSCLQGAVSLTEERESGILERIMAGPGGMAVLVSGKFLFLVFQGFLQMFVIFIAAWLIYGVDLPARFGSWIVVTLVACVAAAGLSLLVAAACRTSSQARSVWTVLVLISSVVGGSMVPRFFMPLWLRDLGWFTPNTWVLEAYSALFWRDAALSEALLPCSLLAIVGLAGFLGAQWLAAQRARL